MECINSDMMAVLHYGYSFTEECLRGSFNEEKKDYDLMTVVVMRLGHKGESSGDDAIRLLSKMFSTNLSYEDKLDALQNEFLPLFANETEGFSAEEHVSRDYWRTGIVEEDPWEWLPYFANARRDGYDFDARWADGLADRREKIIMDFYMDEDENGDVVWKKNIQTHMKRIS